MGTKSRIPLYFSPLRDISTSNVFYIICSILPCSKHKFALEWSIPEARARENLIFYDFPTFCVMRQDIIRRLASTSFMIRRTVLCLS